MRNNAEETLHKAVIQHLKLRAKPHVIYFHTPNGESRSIRTGVRLKAMGVLPGVPDLTIIGDRTYFMELKAPKGTLTPEQRAFRDKAEKLGCPYVVVRDIDHATAMLKAWEVIS